MLVNVQLQNVFVKMDRGLGDTIERVTKATGVKKVVETISKKWGNRVDVVSVEIHLTECFLTNKRKLC